MQRAARHIATLLIIIYASAQQANQQTCQQAQGCTAAVTNLLERVLRVREARDVEPSAPDATTCSDPSEAAAAHGPQQEQCGMLNNLCEEARNSDAPPEQAASPAPAAELTDPQSPLQPEPKAFPWKFALFCWILAALLGVTVPVAIDAFMDKEEDEEEDEEDEAMPSRRKVDWQGRATGKHMKSVVKVYCAQSKPDFSLPWKRKPQYSSTSSGLIIDGHRILTNAHGVEYHTQIKVQRRGSSQKFPASVVSIGLECGLAMLSVEDETFWLGTEPAEFGGLPRLQESVTVIGDPIHGNMLSLTTGVVSRVELTSYEHGAPELLSLQLDPPIASCGPAFDDRGKCTGIAFRHKDYAGNIGHIIPVPVVERFIADYVRSGTYTGFPVVGIEWQKLESPSLRKAVGLSRGMTGVLVRRVDPLSPASKVLQRSDVLLGVNGVRIANDGTVPFRSGERIRFTYLFGQKFVDDKVHIWLLRDNRLKGFRGSLVVPVRLIPTDLKGCLPSYFIVAGLVFTQVTVPYLRSEYGKAYSLTAPVGMVDYLSHASAKNHNQQVVMLSKVLPCDAVMGYEDLINLQVLAVGKRPIGNMRDLANAVDGCNEEFLRVDLEQNQLVVLDTEAAKAATVGVLSAHCIPSDRSANLQPGAGPDADDQPQSELALQWEHFRRTYHGMQRVAGLA